MTFSPAPQVAPAKAEGTGISIGASGRGKRGADTSDHPPLRPRLSRHTKAIIVFIVEFILASAVIFSVALVIFWLTIENSLSGAIYTSLVITGATKPLSIAWREARKTWVGEE